MATHTWSSSGKSSAVRSFSTRAVSSASTWVTHFCNSRIWLSDSWASWTEPSSNRVRSLAYKARCNQALATERFQNATQCRMYDSHHKAQQVWSQQVQWSSYTKNLLAALLYTTFIMDMLLFFITAKIFISLFNEQGSVT